MEDGDHPDAQDSVASNDVGSFRSSNLSGSSYSSNQSSRTGRSLKYIYLQEEIVKVLKGDSSVNSEKAEEHKKDEINLDQFLLGEYGGLHVAGLYS